MLTIDEYGIFIGEISVPYKNGLQFYENNIEPMFKGMLDSMGKTASKAKAPELYQPRAYCMLGNYDMTVISLIDDFHFGAKYFHPYSFLNKNSTDSEPSSEKGFNYHVTMCTYSYDSSLGESDNLLNKVRKSFLCPDKRYPFIGCTNVKVKNSLLVGMGIKLVQVCIHALKIRLIEYAKDVKNFDFIILEPISWNEISIVFFSDSMKKISDALVLVREMNVGYALKEATKNHLIGGEDVLLKTLLHKETGASVKSISESHLYTHTFSNLGVDLEWLRYVDVNAGNFSVPGFLDSSPTYDIEAFTRWFIKPSYLETFLKQNNITEPFNWVIGNGDLEIKKSGVNDFVSLIVNLKAFVFEQGAGVQRKIVRRTKTILRFSYTPSDVKGIVKGYDDRTESSPNMEEWMSNVLKEYVFDQTKIKELRRALIALRVSRTLRERIIGAFINFNDCIQDPILYITFIELRDYLLDLYELIISDSTSTVVMSQEVRHNRYNAFINSFDQAYKSIIIHSYRLYNVTDFNFTYNGGIQAIISGFDAFFKYFRRRLYAPQTRVPFISIVSNEQSIKTNMNSIFVNYNHLFSPEFFFAALPKEAINHYFFNSSRIAEKDELNIKRIISLYKAGEFERAELAIQSYFEKDINAKDLLYCALTIIDQAQEQVTTLFKSRVLEKIRKSSDEHSSIFLEYLDGLYKETIFYFLEDAFASWVLTPNEYIFWLLATFMQESASYNKDGTFNEKYLVRLLLRLSFMDASNDSNNDYIFKLHIRAVNLEQVRYHKNKVDSFLKIIESVQIVPGVTLNTLIQCMFKINKSVYDAATDRSDEVDEKTYDNSSIYILALKTGSVENILLDNKYSSVRAVILAYLSIIKELYPKENILLERRLTDGNPDFDRDGNYRIPNMNNVLLLDPTGGNFTIGAKVRTQYFRVRATLIRALFDFSLKEKLSLFNRDRSTP